MGSVNPFLLLKNGYMPCPFIVSFGFPMYLTVAPFLGHAGFVRGFLSKMYWHATL